MEVLTVEAGAGVVFLDVRMKSFNRCHQIVKVTVDASVTREKPQ